MLSRLTSQWSRVPHSPLLTYGVAVGASLLALGLGTLSEAWINGPPFLLFLAAVTVTTWYGGLGPGLLATLLGSLASSYFFVLPPFSSPLAATTSVFGLVVFVLAAFLSSYLHSSLREARRRAEVARLAAEMASEELRNLQSVSDVALAHLSLKGLLPELLERIRRALRADLVVILLLSEDGEQLVPSAVVGADPASYDGLRIPIGRGIAGRIAESKKPLVVDDVTRFDLATPMLPRRGIRSLIGVPLLVDGRLLGVLDVGTERARRFSRRDLKLLELVSDRISLAIGHAKLYEAERSSRAAAQQAVRIREEFLALASHELRTPLSHIKGFVSTLRQPDVSWDRETQQEFLAEIERETDRLARLIGDLLDLSRLESGGLGGARTPVDPAALIAGGLDWVRSLLNGRPVEIDLAADLPKVEVDASQVERVVANLVENAVKYSLPSTPIRVTARARDGWLALTVEDEGPGVPPERLEQIFEKFVRLRSSRSPVAGAGLGLAICRRIVVEHGGRIRCENRHPGARFVVELPLTSRHASAR